MLKRVAGGRQKALSSSFQCCSDDDRVCRFFVKNKCLRGDACPYSHDLTVDSPLGEAAPADPYDSESCKSICCSICLQSVLVEGRRFGLLPRCNHVFCLDCILAWRNSRPPTGISREAARRCPMCRIPSFFVIPSYRFYTGERKKQRVVEYLDLLSCKPCRYYSESAETELCPYGQVCFFHHRGGQATATPEEAEIEAKINLVYTDGTQDVYGIRHTMQNEN